MATGRDSRVGWLLVATAILLVLAGLEWWLSIRDDVSISVVGVLSGVALTALVIVSTQALQRRAATWLAPAAAGLIAIAELLLGVCLLGMLVGIATWMLPVPLVTRFLSDDMTTDLVVFSLLGLALWVTARSVWRHMRQRALAAELQLAAAEAQATVARRDRELAQSELMVLRAQIEPHFLWNTLAHVQYLIRKKPDDADRMTGYLIRYLRAAVPQIRGDVITLRAEFESVQAYLELMKIRMGERLSVSLHLPEEFAEHACPPLLVQTLVENAIKHGVEPKVGQVHVCVSAGLNEAVPGALVINVEDNGVGLQASPVTRGTGMGLRGVRERLRSMYGDEALLSVMGVSSGGVLARLSLPCQTGFAKLVTDRADVGR
jgi:sensor histidine kinase YesM